MSCDEVKARSTTKDVPCCTSCVAPEPPAGVVAATTVTSCQTKSKTTYSPLATTSRSTCTGPSPVLAGVLGPSGALEATRLSGEERLHPRDPTPRRSPRPRALTALAGAHAEPAPRMIAQVAPLPETPGRREIRLREVGEGGYPGQVPGVRQPNEVWPGQGYTGPTLATSTLWEIPVTLDRDGFRADPTGQQDSTQAFKNARNLARSAGKHGPVVIPAGTYAVDEFDWSGVEWRGTLRGNARSTIVPWRPGQSYVVGALDGQLDLYGLTIECQHTAGVGIHVTSTTSGASLRYCIARNAAGAGVYLRSAPDAVLQNVRAEGNAGAGFLIVGCPGLLAQKLAAEQNGGPQYDLRVAGAVLLGPPQSAPLGWTLDGISARGNASKQPLIKFSGVTGAYLRGGRLVSTVAGAGDGVVLDSLSGTPCGSVTVRDLHLLDLATPVRLKRAWACLFDNLSASRGSIVIEPEASGQGNWIGNCVRRESGATNDGVRLPVIGTA